MAFGDYFSRKPEFDIFPLEVDDLQAAAALHRARFSRAWNDGEFHSLLAQEPVYGFAAWQTNATVRTAAGFVLARAVAGESEILSIGIDPRFEGLGLGWRLMQAASREARMRDAEAMFLEVDEDNARARRLYEKLGFVKVGERKAYYADARGVRSAALVMRRDLR